jgi:hypothetical protein
MTGLIISIGNYIGGIISGGVAPVIPDFIIMENGVDFVITEGGDNIITQ